MLDSAPLADPCQKSIDPSWPLWHFSLPRFVHMGVSFPARKHDGLQYQNQFHTVHETGYRILLSLLAGIAISANLQPRYNDPKAAVALDLALELFKHIADEL